MKTSYHGFEGRTRRYIANKIGLRSCLPYGKWTCEDGTEYLFNRGYGPIFKRTGTRVELVNPGTWVHGIQKQEWFYDDLNAPYAPCSNSTSLKRCLDVLDEWGVLDVNAYSRLSDAGSNVPVDPPRGVAQVLHEAGFAPVVETATREAEAKRPGWREVLNPDLRAKADAELAAILRRHQ